jgi:zeaxanthin glucosyltransferase
MAHLGILCPASIGHLNSMCALGRALKDRGHRITLFQIPMAEANARAAGLDFQPIGSTLYTPELLAS